MSYITPMAKRKGLKLWGSPNEVFLVLAIVVLSLCPAQVHHLVLDIYMIYSSQLYRFLACSDRADLSSKFCT